MMNTGRLKQALPYYEKVMNVVDFILILCSRKITKCLGLIYICGSSIISELLDSGEKMNFQLNPVLGEKSITLLLNV